MEGFKPKLPKRDAIDSMLTYVNKDLLICKLFYFFFFAAFGSLYPLLAIYFKQLGMNATQSGILMGFRPFIEFCSAPFWGGIADKFRKWRQLQLFSLFCWIVFTLAMAFVKPPPISCSGDNNVTAAAADEVHLKDDLIKPAYSTVYFEREAVRDAFFTLLLIIVIGEFFSAPAITFADTVTLSYLGDDTDNYGRQRMFGSAGWALSMFFVGMALDHSTTFPEHPCEKQHHKEKNYMICFAVFSVLMSCAFITATQFKFPGQGSGKDQTWPSVLIAMKDRVTETITGKKRIDRETLVEEDDEFQFGQHKSQLAATDADKSQQGKLSENGKPLQISLESKTDMVYDTINSPGSQFHGNQHMAPPNPDEPFLGRWVAVLRLLAQLKFVTVLFVLWFMGFGIGLIFTFLFWHLQDLGGSPTLFGVASVINHISELLAYFLCPRFIAAFGHINVLYAGLVGNVARFLYISWLPSPTWVLIFEFIQGLTHAAVWATTCSYIMAAVPVPLRTSAQGILQGLHHGLGRGCGAVFGGVLVYSYGSAITFRAYGVTCIFVLAAFFGINYFLKSRGIPVDSHVPHATLEEDPSHFDPHGVPSGLVRDLSSSKLNKQEGMDINNPSSFTWEIGVSKPEVGTNPSLNRGSAEVQTGSTQPRVWIRLVPEVQTSYGSTLGTGTNARTDLEKAFSPPEQSQDDDFNPRATKRDTAFNAYDDGEVIDPYKPKPAPRESNQSSRDPYQSSRDPYQSSRDSYQQSSQSSRDEPQPRSGTRSAKNAGYDQDTRDYSSRQDESFERRDEPSMRRRASDESPRHYTTEHSERKERRRRQSGDVEGLRERDDPYGRKESRERERRGYGDRGEDESRGHRRTSKHRRSIDGNQFQDPDPNPREKVVFEQLPDLTRRSQPHQHDY